jgi:LysM repeat protein
MPKAKKTTTTKVTKTTKVSQTNNSLSQRMQDELSTRQSYLNLGLGILVVLVLGLLVFNYFKSNQDNLMTAQQTTQSEQPTANPVVPDVATDSLPGKYTVKQGDTLFTIAQKYYNDGYKFDSIMTENKMSSDAIEVGQVLQIPKLVAQANPSPSPQVQAPNPDNLGTGGAINQTAWGEKINGDTYTVQAGDWLSTIAGRAYGDIYSFEKIAKANNLTDPNVIEPGTVLKIPR